MFEKLTSFLDSFIEMGVPWYDCIIMQQGNVVYRHKNGFSDRENKLPVSGKERINLYSCSKPITCTAALQLVEKGAISLDDELCKFLPEFENMMVITPEGPVPAERKITIWNLFTMTAGFSYRLGVPSLLKCIEETHGACPTREVMRYLAREPLFFQPGTGWEYSLCHDVLAAVVEVVSGMTFNDYLKKNIFDPLGMKDTTFLLPETEIGTIAPQYACSAYGEHGVIRISPRNMNYDFTAVPFRLGTDYASGGAGCVSTLEDYVKFLEAMRKGDEILSNRTIDLMTTNQLSPELRKTCWVEQSYGYGLGVRCPGADPNGPSDSGWGGAAGSYLAFDRINQITIFYAQHVLHSPNAGLRSQIPGRVLEELGL